MEFEATQVIYTSCSESEEEEDKVQKKPVAFLHFICNPDGAEEARYPLFKGENSIGRKSDCTVHLNNKALSKEHAVIEIQTNSYLIYDLGSSNRTKKGQRVLKPHVRYDLQDGELISFANLECHFKLQKHESKSDLGSETGSESMISTDNITENQKHISGNGNMHPVDSPFNYEKLRGLSTLQETKGKNSNASLLEKNHSDQENLDSSTLEIAEDSSNASSDLLLPQNYGDSISESRTPSRTLVVMESDTEINEKDEKSKEGIPAAIILETPVISKTLAVIANQNDSASIPEDSDTDLDDIFDVPTQPCLVTASHSDENVENENVALMNMETQDLASFIAEEENSRIENDKESPGPSARILDNNIKNQKMKEIDASKTKNMGILNNDQETVKEIQTNPNQTISKLHQKLNEIDIMDLPTQKYIPSESDDSDDEQEGKKGPRMSQTATQKYSASDNKGTNNELKDRNSKNIADIPKQADHPSDKKSEAIDTKKIKHVDVSNLGNKKGDSDDETDDELVKLNEPDIMDLPTQKYINSDDDEVDAKADKGNILDLPTQKYKGSENEDDETEDELVDGKVDITDLPTQKYKGSENEDDQSEDMLADGKVDITDLPTQKYKGSENEDDETEDELVDGKVDITDLPTQKYKGSENEDDQSEDMLADGKVDISDLPTQKYKGSENEDDETEDELVDGKVDITDLPTQKYKGSENEDDQSEDMLADGKVDITDLPTQKYKGSENEDDVTEDELVDGKVDISDLPTQKYKGSENEDDQSEDMLADGKVDITDLPTQKYKGSENEDDVTEDELVDGKVDISDLPTQKYKGSENEDDETEDELIEGGVDISELPTLKYKDSGDETDEDLLKGGADMMDLPTQKHKDLDEISKETKEHKSTKSFTSISSTSKNDSDEQNKINADLKLKKNVSVKHSKGISECNVSSNEGQECTERDEVSNDNKLSNATKSSAKKVEFSEAALQLPTNSVSAEIQDRNFNKHGKKSGTSNKKLSSRKTKEENDSNTMDFDLPTQILDESEDKDIDAANTCNQNKSSTSDISVKASIVPNNSNTTDVNFSNFPTQKLEEPEDNNNTNTYNASKPSTSDTVVKGSTLFSDIEDTEICSQNTKQNIRKLALQIHSETDESAKTSADELLGDNIEPSDMTLCTSILDKSETTNISILNKSIAANRKEVEVADNKKLKSKDVLGNILSGHLTEKQFSPDKNFENVSTENINEVKRGGKARRGRRGGVRLKTSLENDGIDEVNKNNGQGKTLVSSEYLASQEEELKLPQKTFDAHNVATSTIVEAQTEEIPRRGRRLLRGSAAAQKAKLVEKVTDDNIVHHIPKEDQEAKDKESSETVNSTGLSSSNLRKSSRRKGDVASTKAVDSEEKKETPVLQSLNPKESTARTSPRKNKNTSEIPAKDSQTDQDLLLTNRKGKQLKLSRSRNREIANREEQPTAKPNENPVKNSLFDSVFSELLTPRSLTSPRNQSPDISRNKQTYSKADKEKFNLSKLSTPQGDSSSRTNLRSSRSQPQENMTSTPISGKSKHNFTSGPQQTPSSTRKSTRQSQEVMEEDTENLKSEKQLSLPSTRRKNSNLKIEEKSNNNSPKLRSSKRNTVTKSEDTTNSEISTEEELEIEVSKLQTSSFQETHFLMRPRRSSNTNLRSKRLQGETNAPQRSVEENLKTPTSKIVSPLLSPETNLSNSNQISGTNLRSSKRNSQEIVDITPNKKSSSENDRKTTPKRTPLLSSEKKLPGTNKSPITNLRSSRRMSQGITDDIQHRDSSTDEDLTISTPKRVPPMSLQKKLSITSLRSSKKNSQKIATETASTESFTDENLKISTSKTASPSRSFKRNSQEITDNKQSVESLTEKDPKRTLPSSEKKSSQTNKLPATNLRFTRRIFHEVSDDTASRESSTEEELECESSRISRQSKMVNAPLSTPSSRVAKDNQRKQSPSTVIRNSRNSTLSKGNSVNSGNIYSESDSNISVNTRQTRRQLMTSESAEGEISSSPVQKRNKKNINVVPSKNTVVKTKSQETVLQRDDEISKALYENIAAQSKNKVQERRGRNQRQTRSSQSEILVQDNESGTDIEESLQSSTHTSGNSRLSRRGANKVINYAVFGKQGLTSPTKENSSQDHLKKIGAKQDSDDQQEKLPKIVPNKIEANLSVNTRQKSTRQTEAKGNVTSSVDSSSKEVDHSKISKKGAVQATKITRAVKGKITEETEQIERANTSSIANLSPILARKSRAGSKNKKNDEGKEEPNILSSDESIERPRRSTPNVLPSKTRQLTQTRNLEASIKEMEESPVSRPSRLRKRNISENEILQSSGASSPVLPTKTVKLESTATPITKKAVKRGRSKNLQEENESEIPAKKCVTPPSNTGHAAVKSTPRKSVEKKIPIHAMFTGVVDKAGEKILKDLGGKLVDSVEDCTHLITDKVRRTFKFLCIVARGRPVVTCDWLKHCKAANSFIARDCTMKLQPSNLEWCTEVVLKENVHDCSPYIVKDKAAEQQFGFQLSKALTAANSHSLLTNYSIHVTTNVKPEPAQMKLIIECAGGKYLNRMPNIKGDNTVVISCPEDLKLCNKALAAGIPVVEAEFILTGILRQEIDINSFNILNKDNNTSARSSPSPAKRGRKRR